MIKLTFLLLLVSTLVLQVNPRKDFCLGFEVGYKSGWCLNDPACLEPLVPLCPLPLPDQDTYSAGLAIGVKQGVADRKTYDSTWVNNIER